MDIIKHITGAFYSRLLELFQGKARSWQAHAQPSMKKYIHQLRLDATFEYLANCHYRGEALAHCHMPNMRNAELMFEMADRLERQMLYANRQPIS